MMSHDSPVGKHTLYAWTSVITGRQCPAKPGSLISKVLHLTIPSAITGAQRFFSGFTDLSRFTSEILRPFQQLGLDLVYLYRSDSSQKRWEHLLISSWLEIRKGGGVSSRRKYISHEPQREYKHTVRAVAINTSHDTSSNHTRLQSLVLSTDCRSCRFGLDSS